MTEVGLLKLHVYYQKISINFEKFLDMQLNSKYEKWGIFWIKNIISLFSIIYNCLLKFPQNVNNIL